MTYFLLIFIALSSYLFPVEPQAAKDSISVFEDESYIELDLPFASIRNISTAFNPVNDYIYAFDRNSSDVLWEFKPDGSISALDTLDIPGVNNMLPMDITQSGESLLLWEQGLGKVFKYSFADSSLNQIDQTRVRDLMFGHGSVIMEDERILAIGGYGFWEFRNLLLAFNRDGGEWNKIETHGETPATPFTYNFLGYEKDKNRLIYIFVPHTAVEKKTGPSGIRTFNPFFEIYTLNLRNNEWSYRNRIHPEKSDLSFLNRPRSRTTHSIDESRGIFIFNGRLALNTDTYELYYVTHPSIEDMWYANFYYSKNSDRWIVIGKNNNLIKEHLIVRSFPASEAQLSPLEEELAAYIVWLGWFLGGGFSLTLVYLGIFKWKDRAKKQKASTAKALELIVKNGNLSASIEGKSIDMSDPVMKEFLNVVYSMKKQEKSEILMSEFDNLIFTDQHSQPFRSKTKKKIFKLINNKFDEPFVTIDVYPLDKRYKMIVLDLESVAIRSLKFKINGQQAENAA